MQAAGRGRGLLGAAPTSIEMPGAGKRGKERAPFGQVEFGEVVKYKLIVTNVLNPVTFYAQEHGQVKDFEKLSKRIFQVCSITKPLSDLPEVDKIYAALYNDGQFYRCKVIRNNVLTRQSSVNFIDHGVIETKPIRNLYEVPDDVASMPPMAVRFKLNGLKSVNSSADAGVHFLKDYLANTIVEASVTNRVNYQGLLADVTAHGRNLGELLLTRGFAQVMMDKPFHTVNPNYYRSDYLYDTVEQPSFGPSYPPYPTVSMALANYQDFFSGYKMQKDESQVIQLRQRLIKVERSLEKARAHVSKTETQMKAIRQERDTLRKKAKPKSIRDQFVTIRSALSRCHNLRREISSDPDADAPLQTAIKILEEPLSLNYMASVVDVIKAGEFLDNCHKMYEHVKEKEPNSPLSVALKSAKDNLRFSLSNFPLDLDELTEYKTRVDAALTTLNNMTTPTIMLDQPPQPVENISAHIQKWKENHMSEVEEARKQTDICLKDVEGAVDLLKSVLVLSEEDFTIPDVDGLVNSLQEALNIEASACDLMSSPEAVNSVKYLKVKLSQNLSMVSLAASFKSKILEALEKLDADDIVAAIEEIEKMKESYDRQNDAENKKKSRKSKNQSEEVTHESVNKTDTEELTKEDSTEAEVVETETESPTQESADLDLAAKKLAELALNFPPSNDSGALVGDGFPVMDEFKLDLTNSNETNGLQ